MGNATCEVGIHSLTTPSPFSPTLDSPTISLSSPKSSSNASPVANVTSPATPDLITTLSRGQKAAVGTAVPLGGIAFLVLVLVLWQRTKKQRAKIKPRQIVQEETTEDNPTFLQPKPELQSEDSRHEMQAEDQRFELDGGSTRYEMMTEERNKRVNVQVQ